MKQNRTFGIAALVAGVLVSNTGVFAGKQGRVDLSKMVTPLYTVDGDAFTIHNGERYSNRPLYCNHIYAIVLAGDKPCAMVGKMANIYGNLMCALVRGGKGTWLQNASDITSTYRPGRMEWVVKDQAWGSTAVDLEIVPTSNGPGMVAHATIENPQPGDSLVWASGAAKMMQKGSILWEYDMTSLKSGLDKRGFTPSDCESDTVSAQGNSWKLLSKDKGAEPATGTCSAQTDIVVGDADSWQDPVALLKSHAASKPIVCGQIDVASNHDVYWDLLGPGAGNDKSPADEFSAGMEREKSIENRVTIDTPDPWLNAGVGASSIVVDACYRDGVYTHSGMRWSTALLGWRTVYGGTVFGWHGLVKDDAKLFIGSQITEDQPDKTQPVADPKTRLTSQAPNSMMFGKGHIELHDPHHYDMQSQFFDQIEHAWRWTGDAELEKLLKPSLDLDCEWIRKCYDPYNLGIYESYANTWPTDDQFYNGGGTSEETAYAFRAELTALQLAQRAGDQQGIVTHTAAIDRIKKGFFDLLWVKDKGFPGGYREQYGLKRLHESGWLYAIFCPIDAGLLSPEQAASSLYYTEWAMERMKMPYGGEQCWPSNWVPSIWSVREMWSGDDYALALAYFQTGMPDEGWKVFRGMFPQQEIFGPVPGDMGHPSGGTDFNDCNSMFARTVVEGLFGYTPDYPNGVVKIAPQFPTDWDHASIKTTDMSIAFRHDGLTSEYKITLANPCAMDLELPVSASEVSSVSVNDAPATSEIIPGFGRSVVKVHVPSTGTAVVKLTAKDQLPTVPSIYTSANVGDAVTLKPATGETIVDFHDPQSVLQGGKLEGDGITGTIACEGGDHMVFALIKTGDLKQWQMFKIHVTDVKADAELAAKTNVDIPKGATFDPVDLKSTFNGDIQTIYQQQYVSPRPNTCSLRLATDGYSTWQMSGGPKMSTPTVKLNSVESLTDGHGNILAGSVVPFPAPAEGKNIAFTSLWDNWPHQVSVPVNKSGKAIWFLVCGTTNHMEVRISNAQLRMTYADGVVEKLDLVPPFNFWTLCPLSGNDYDYKRDAFSLPKVPPKTVQLGTNCRAILLPWKLRPGVKLKDVTLECLSNEVVIGLMGATVMN
jgi:hypothetical protein